MSNNLSYSSPRRPCSTSINTLRVTPDRSASCSCVSPWLVRSSRIRAPTAIRTCSHRATRSGSFWLGRVGTHPNYGAPVPNVCPTSSTLRNVSSVYSSTAYDETASVVGVALLDELRISVLECLLVVEALPEEVTLKFDELTAELHAVYRSAQLAHSAASLLQQGAELDERWGNNLSRPKAVFARHNSAVRQGAAVVAPLGSMAAAMERRLWALPALDRTQDVTGPRPVCNALTRTTGEECKTTAIYLGAGVFGAHCYRHATAGERDQYRAHHEAVDARQGQSRELLQELQRSMGEEISAEWLQRREEPQRWFSKIP